MKQERKFSDLDVAIVGISCRFPGAQNWREYWKNLIDSKESIRMMDEQELNKYGVEKSKRDNPKFIRAVSLIDGKENFDHNFFDYRFEEAVVMNPQHRIFHECAWEAFEDAGYDPTRGNYQIGVFAGAGQDLSWQIYTNIANDRKVDGFTLSQINNKDFLSSLLSYKLNLKGPAITVNTACSTSAVAVHLASRSLLLGECTMALAGGISLFTDASKGYYYEDGMIFSKDGHCRAFDKNSSGTIVGEGAGIVLLKRMKNAVQDNDHIYAVIKGSAINNDGNRKVGYSAPSIDGQVDCIRAALKFAKVEPTSISYIETHGTGTPLGDPIELAALNTAYAQQRGKCAIGSVKTNIGHLDAAAGIAGLIKTALCLYHRKLPASLNFSEPNPEINFSNGPFFVNNELRDWSPQEPFAQLRAAVSSFGIGGTNAHIILEEFGDQNKDVTEPRFNILTLSAKNEDSVSRSAQNVKKYLEDHEAVNLNDLCYSFQKGRKKFNYRKSFVFQRRSDLLRKLSAEYLMTASSDKKYGFAFVFGGEAEVWNGLGRDLYRNIASFKNDIDSGFEILSDLTGGEFENVFLNKSTGINPDKVYSSCYAMLVQHALGRYLIALGVKPSSIFAYGFGEIVAACVSEVFGLKDAVWIMLRKMWEHRTEFQFHFSGKNLQVEDLHLRLQSISLNQPKFPCIVSHNVLGSDSDISKIDYWYRYIKTIGVSACSGLLPTLEAQNNIIYLKLGPGNGDGIFSDKNFNSLSLLSKQDSLTDEQKSVYLVLGELWERVHDLDLIGVFDSDSSRKISIPTYSFVPTKFPVEVNTNDILKHFGKLNYPTRKEKTEDYFYQAVWQHSPIFNRGEAQLSDGGFLLFVNDYFILFSEKYIPLGVRVRCGNSYARNGKRDYIVNPERQEDYNQLFVDLKNDNYPPSNIIHSWTLNMSAAEGDDLQILGYHSVLKIVKAYINVFESAPLQIDLVSDKLFSITDNDPVIPHKATIIGAAKVIPKEFANISTRVIDLKDVDGDAGEILFKEIQHLSENTEVGLRGRKRFIRAHTPVKLKAPEPEQVFKIGGTYLITGSNGGMGRFFSEYLSQKFQANLIMIARSKMPSSFLNQLHENGSSVFVIEADVASSEVGKGISRALLEFKKIDGVIHTAGVLDFAGTILKRSVSDDESIFSPKISGTLNLWSYLKSQPLDFFVNCSSLSATTAPFGEVAYVASNIFLDQFAEAVKDKYPMISIQWCTLREIGGAVRATQHMGPEQQEVALQLGISSDEALQVLLTAVYFKIPNPIISTIDLALHLIPQDQVGSVSEDATFRAAVFSKRPLLSTEYQAPGSDVENNLISLVEQFFGIEGLGVNDDFFELAGDSLKAMMLIRRIEKKFDVFLTLKDFFDLRDFGHIAQKIENKLANKRSAQILHTDADSIAKPLENNPAKAHIIPLNSSSAKELLFLIPGSHGISDDYFEIANAFSERFSVHGIQMRGSLEGETPFDAIENIAKENISWMKQVQPIGPYRIIGHSFGGHVAFEMVKQLEYSNEALGFLCLLDIDAHSRDRSDINAKKALILEIISETIQAITEKNISYQFFSQIKGAIEEHSTVQALKDALMHRIQEWCGKHDAGIEHVLNLMWLKICNECIHYPITASISSKVAIVKAGQNDRGSIDPYLGWQKYCAGEVFTFTSEGDHFTMVNRDNASGVVRFLEELVLIS